MSSSLVTVYSICSCLDITIARNNRVLHNWVPSVTNCCFFDGTTFAIYLRVEVNCSSVF